ncbi:hypothetical protein YPPY01_2018, partial [Yersinia pestis PY-01]
MKIYFILF